MNRRHTTIRHAQPLRLAVLALPGVLGLAGCLNESTSLTHAGTDPLPDLGNEAAAPEAGVATTTLDRNGWPSVVLIQPRGQVEWSFFGTAQPDWAVARGPGELGEVPTPQFAPARGPVAQPASASSTEPTPTPSQH
jgi:hypothetical protein